ncbi:MAG: nucleoside recognition protein, partial [Acetivibrio sp.]
IITKIGGYIILFSLLATIIKVHFPLPVLTKTILCGILEITTGMNLLFESMYSSSTKLLIGMFIASFGGLSALFQTKSVIKESGLSIRSYTFAKVCSSLLCVCFTKILLLFNIL